MSARKFQAEINQLTSSELPYTLKTNLFTSLKSAAMALLDSKEIGESDPKMDDDIREKVGDMMRDQTDLFALRCVQSISTFIDNYVQEIVDSTIQAKILAGELMSGMPGGNGAGQSTGQSTGEGGAV